MGYKKTWFEYRGRLNTSGKQAGTQGLRVSSPAHAKTIVRRDNPGDNMYTRSFRARHSTHHS